MAHSSLLIRKDVYEQYGNYQKGSFPEDYQLILSWLEQGVKIEKVKEFLLDWRDHDQRLTRNHPSYSQDAFYWLKAKYFAKWYSGQKEQKPILIWGTGKSVLNKSAYLKEFGIDILGYIDVKENDKPDHFHYLKYPVGCFILSYVSDRKGKVEIKRFLEGNGAIIGVDFLMMS